MTTAFLGKGAVARKIVAYDWSQHPLGPLDRWPVALRIALGMALDSDFPMFLVWTDQFYAFYNDAYMPILGSKEPSALGRRFAEVWSEAWPVVGPIAEKAYAGASTYFDDLPIVIDRHGYPEQTYFSFSYSPVRDEHGSVAGVLCTVFETTAKVAALARLKESEGRLQLSLEAAGNIGTWAVDPVTQALTVDARFARLFEVDPASAERADLSLSAFTDRIHPDDRPRVLQAIADTMETCKPYAAEYRLNRADDTQIWVAARGRFFTDESTGKQSVAGVAVNITRRKHIENDLRRLADDLALSNRRQQEFLAVLAHELRNPLAPIRTGLDLIASSQDNPATTARVREMMTRQVDHLVHLVDDLLDLARITSGRIVPKMGQVTLKDIVSQAIETTLPAIEARQHRFTVHLPDEPVWLYADANRVAQVVANVLSNAAKYTPPNGAIKLTASCAADCAILAVTDNGIGIPPEALPHIFDMFNQVHRAGEYAQGGLGIGLALVKRLAELHGGTVSAASAGPNCGSTFTIRLPIVDATPRIGGGSVHLAARRPAAGRWLRILLADDNADAMSTLAQILALEGHEVRTAPDGEQGLALARDWTPDVALLDLGMPKLNGFQTAQAMRACATLQGIRLVALTGWGADEDRARTAQAGFDKHFTKPLDLDQLRTYLASIVARSDQQPREVRR